MSAKTFTLSRDGQRAVRFQGTCLAEARGSWHRGKDQNRYYDLSVYATEDGRFVVAWAYYTRWQGEEDYHRVEVSRSLASVVTDLENFDPTVWVQGYKGLIANHPHYNKPGQKYYERQLALERGIRERYAAQVRELCMTLGVSHDLVENL